MEESNRNTGFHEQERHCDNPSSAVNKCDRLEPDTSEERQLPDSASMQEETIVPVSLNDSTQQNINSRKRKQPISEDILQNEETDADNRLKLESLLKLSKSSKDGHVFLGYYGELSLGEKQPASVQESLYVARKHSVMKKVMIENLFRVKSLRKNADLPITSTTICA